MECRYCGQRLKDGYEYCPNCGGRVEPPEQQARPVQPAYAPQGAYSAPVQGYSPQEAEGCVYGMLQPGAGLGRGLVVFFLADIALLPHLVQNIVAAGQVVVRVSVSPGYRPRNRCVVYSSEKTINR